MYTVRNEKGAMIAKVPSKVLANLLEKDYIEVSGSKFYLIRDAVFNILDIKFFFWEGYYLEKSQ